VKATIVTPTLNAETYVAECLASVVSQGVDEVEHLVVDGGSTDATHDIVRGYPSVTWVSQPGWRQTRSINEGLRRASGDVVAWLNADDAYAPGALSTVLERFDTRPDLDMVFGDCQVVGPDGQPLWWERPGSYDFRRLLRRGNYIAQPAAFMRKRIFDDLGYLDESLEYGMDFDLWLRVRGRAIEYLPRPLARFRWHPESKSSRGQMRSWNEFLRIVRRHGGGWTPEIAWAFARCLITIARTRVGTAVTGSPPLRPLTRGHHFLESS
jgi:glycosyltransferase involved in cell wall biosynthesis